MCDHLQALRQAAEKCASDRLYLLSERPLLLATAAAQKIMKEK